jgi:DNA-binding response OmpR family regulator
MDKKYKILVAEDEEVIRDIISIALEELPFKNLEISYTKDGLEAFKELRSVHFDLFITDFNMPKMDGESLLELWRMKIFPTHCPKLLFITGDASSVNKVLSNDEGVFTLLKPFDITRLSKLLKLIISSDNK